MLFHASPLKITNILDVCWYNDLSSESELIFNDESYGILRTKQMQVALVINIWRGEWLG